MAFECTKVLFLMPNLMGGGAERVFSILLRYLDRRCFQPHLAVLHTQGPYIRDLPGDVVIHDLRVSRVRYALPAIVRLVWTLRPQTVISTFRYLNLLLILSKPLLPRNTKLLVRETSIPTAVLADSSYHPYILRQLYRHLYKRADQVVGLSDAMVSDLVQNFDLPPQKIVRIYNPVDSQRIRELAEIGPNPFSGPGPHLVAAGRFFRVKGFDLLLAALPSVVRRFPTADVVILGEGPLRGELARQAHQYGLLKNLRFPGFDANPWRYFRHADVFVLPSRYEGMPNVLLEALAVGVPVVATDCPGGVREIQTCHPEMVLVPPEDPDALTEAIILVCDRSCKGDGRRERSAANLSKFDLQQVVGEYSRLLKPR